MKHKDVAVVGMACRFPGARDYHAFWENLVNSVNSVREIPPERWDIDEYYSPDISTPNKSISKWCGLIDDVDQFDNRFFGISAREAKNMDPQQRLLLEETWHCIEDSGIPIDILQKSKTSVFVGVMSGDYYKRSMVYGVDTDSYAALGNYESILANRISYVLGLTGSSLSVNSACAASLTAVSEAVRLLRSGESDYAITAGVNLNLHPFKYISFSKSRMLSPNGQCRTFDKDADGYVPGDGVGVLLLQPLEKAMAAGNPIHGIVKGCAMNHVGPSLSITAPRVEAQKEVILAAYNDAGLTPAVVNYVEAHGTGTSLGDPIEVEALTRAFGEHTEASHFCGIGSVKTNIGHLEGAAGIAGTIKVLLMMAHKKIPPTLNIRMLNPVINFEESPFVPAMQLTDWEPVGKDMPLRASVSSFGFGGVNSHVIMEAYDPGDGKPAEPENDRAGYPFVLSAKSAGGLNNTIGKWREFALSERYETLGLRDICATLMTGRESYAWRHGFMVETKEKLGRLLHEMPAPLENLKPADHRRVCLVIGSVPWNGMDGRLKSLVKRLPDFKAELAAIKKTLTELESGKKLIKGFQAEEWPDAKRELFSFLVNHAWLTGLLNAGVTPSSITGVGNGIWQALVMSGMMNSGDALSVISGAKNYSDIRLTRPKTPFFDPASRKMIMPWLFDKAYLAALADGAAVSGEEIKSLIEKSRLLITCQFTFKRFMEEWDGILRKKTNINLLAILMNDDISSGFVGKKGVLIALVLENAIRKLDQKWDLKRKSAIEDEIANEILDLLIDDVMSKEMLADLFALETPDFAGMAEALDKMQNKVDPNKPYPLLKKNGRAFSAKPGTGNWPEKAMAAEIPRFENKIVLVFGEKRENRENTFHLDPRESRESDLRKTFLDLWLSGINIRWDHFHREHSFNRLALPTYGFDRSSFWLTGDYKVKKKKYRKHLKVNEPIVSEHVITGKPLLPGAAMVQFGLEAVRREVDEPVATLKNIVFKHPGIVTKNTMVEVSVFEERKRFVIKTDEYVLCEGDYA